MHFSLLSIYNYNIYTKSEDILNLRCMVYIATNAYDRMPELTPARRIEHNISRDPESILYGSG